MRSVNWRVVAPIIFIGLLLGWLAVWRLASASSGVLPWLGVWVAIAFIAFALMAVAAWLRRRQSSRTWDLMKRVDPSATHFIAFIYPSVKIQLGRLGWHLHGSAYASIPAIGVGIGSSSLTFWEAGAEGPTLTLAASDIDSATFGRVSDGYRSHPAIEIMLNTAHRSHRLQLNLRDVRHHNLSPAGMREALKAVPVMHGTGSN